ncbi:HigA family addiction module antitoxin [Hyphomicrobium sp. 2TAF46]|uniref:HigA family addiction module antitoxin n=1 Tax=Hyphomicrobium sp. 2TAF46 TaxID=3233019 RepID=UPI003F9316D6
MGVSRRALYDILEGKSAITAPTALRLEAVLGSSAEFWLVLQSQHDLWKARKDFKAA